MLLLIIKINSMKPWQSLAQWRRKIDNWGGANIHIFVFTDLKNNRFQKKLIMQNTIYEYCPPPPPQLSIFLRHCFGHQIVFDINARYTVVPLHKWEYAPPITLQQQCGKYPLKKVYVNVILELFGSWQHVIVAM